MYCDVCRGNKKVRLPTVRELNAVEMFGDAADAAIADPDPGWKEFDCPQCAMVPFRRVRATKLVTAYPAEEYGRLQVPIERSLAARFGEYLMREGLIRFSTTGSKDLGPVTDKITVIAHLGVVSRADTARAGAVEEVATTTRPPLSERIRKKTRVSERAVKWEPPPEPAALGDDITDEFDEPKDALGARFAGLEI